MRSVGRPQERAGAVAPEHGDDWVALTGDPLPLEVVSSWVTHPRCGAVVTFTGTTRDHSAGRCGIERLEYEAYEDQALRRLGEVADEVRRRWHDVGRLAVMHRTGTVALEEASVLVAVSAPHRDTAFEAARFAIDTVKSSVPVWKREAWDGGSAWASDAHDIEAVR